MHKAICMQLNLQPLAIIFAILLLSLLIGLPIALYLARRTDSNGRFSYTVLYLALAVGYSVINLLIFFATLISRSGTNGVAFWTLAGMLAVSSITIFIQRRELFALFQRSNAPALIFFALVPFAAAHVLIPIIAGRWEMAYATGDDAARWYMVINYFQEHVFEYMGVTEETLKWGMRERPLQNVAGSIIVSLFKTTPATAYSISSSLASIMSAISFCLLFEAIFPIQEARRRYVLWFLAILFFGLSGSMTNIYYTGRITHHFSVYPVLASLGFVAVEDTGMRRFLWYALWSVLLAHFYSIRFSFNFLGLAGVILSFQWFAGSIEFRQFVKNIAAMIGGFLIACIASYGEVKAILDSFVTDGLFFFMLQRDPSYGAEGTGLDRLFKWSGFLGTYESHEVLPLLLKLSLGGMILFFMFLSVFKAARSFKQAPSYTGLVGFSLISAAALLFTQNYYVAWKSALYWPSYALLGILALSFELMNSQRRFLNVVGKGIAVLILAYTLLTARQLKYYWDMADERYTKVDDVSYELVQKASEYLANCHDCESRQILGFDYSAERHLLLREIFRGFDWQPIRGKELWFEHDLINKRPELFDEYDFDVLLYAKAFQCELFDFSGNQRSLFYASGPFKLYGRASSFPEFRRGIEIRLYGYDEERRCSIYGGEIVDDSALVVFVNNGQHRWLDLKVRLLSQGEKSLLNTLMIKTDNQKALPSTLLVGEGKEYADYRLEFQNVNYQRITNIELLKAAKNARVVITSAVWGY